MKRVKLIIHPLPLLLVLSLAFNSCKKYPEDGKLSWHTVKYRLFNTWLLKECIVNEQECIYKKYTATFNINSVQDSIIYTLKDAELRFSYEVGKNKNGNEQGDYLVRLDATNYLYAGNDNLTSYGVISPVHNFSFSNRKKEIVFDSELLTGLKDNNYDLNNRSAYFDLKNNPWKIRKLTDKEMILETINFFNQKVRLKFQR